MTVPPWRRDWQQYRPGSARPRPRGFVARRLGFSLNRSSESKMLNRGGHWSRA